MLTYASHGIRNFGKDPVDPKVRGSWEFFALLRGRLLLKLEGPAGQEAIETPTLLAFPPTLFYGFSGRGKASRAVLDFSTVPMELEAMLPPRGYYRVPLLEDECREIRILAGCACQTLERPTELTALEHQTLAGRLSLLALREVQVRPLRGRRRTQIRIERALAWYATNMDEGPGIEQVAKAVNVSAVHLRRLFHEATGRGPKAAFHRLRMERIEELLSQSDLGLADIAQRVGLSDAVALSHAVKTHYGVPPGRLRQRRRRQAAMG